MTTVICRRITCIHNSMKEGTLKDIEKSPVCKASVIEIELGVGCGDSYMNTPEALKCIACKGRGETPAPDGWAICRNCSGTGKVA